MEKAATQKPELDERETPNARRVICMTELLLKFTRDSIEEWENSWRGAEEAIIWRDYVYIVMKNEKHARNAAWVINYEINGHNLEATRCIPAEMAQMRRGTRDKNPGNSTAK